MGCELIRSALEVYGPQWWRVDLLQAREDVRAGLFNRDPGRAEGQSDLVTRMQAREAKTDRFVLLVAMGFLAGAMIGRYGGNLHPGELRLGQVAEFVDGGEKVHGNGRESESYLRAAFGGLAGTCGEAPAALFNVWGVDIEEYLAVPFRRWVSSPLEIERGAVGSAPLSPNRGHGLV